MNLTVNDLSFSFRNRPVLKNISFEVPSGCFVSVLGPNGVGKSTLFRCILRLLTDYEGTICVDGRNTASLSGRELAEHIAYIPQIHRPVFGYSVLDTVLMGVTGRCSPLAQPTAEQKNSALLVLEKLGIPELAGRNFSQLSGGEQQLVLIARALAQRADVLVMDEPTSALDYGNQIRVLKTVRKLTEEGYSVLLSTHNPQHALSFSDKVIALHACRLIACGSSKEVLTPELIFKLFGVSTYFTQTQFGTVIVNKP